MGQAVLAAIIIGGGIGAISGAYLLYLLSEPSRWQAFLDRLRPLVDNPVTRWAFDNSVGPAINLSSIEESIAKGNHAKAKDLAVAEGLVDETIHAFQRNGLHLEAARLARRMGDDAAAADIYRTAVDALESGGNLVGAAEAAEEAGFAEEAVARFEALGGASSCLRAARIASTAGMAEKAVTLFLVNEDFLNAARTAERHGLTDLMFDLCENSDNPALHMFGAESAARTGRLDYGLDILLRHGHLHQAAQYAKERGMTEKLEEIIGMIREAKAERARRLYEGGFGNFGPDQPGR